MKTNINTKNNNNTLVDSHHKHILDTVFDGYCLIDEEGNFCEVNQKLADLWGYTQEELLTMKVHLIDFYESEYDSMKRIIKIREQQTVRFETKHLCKNGKTIDVEVDAALIGDDGKFCAVVKNLSKGEHADKFPKDSNKKLKTLLTQAKKKLTNKEELIDYILNEIKSFTDSTLAFYGSVDEKNNTIRIYYLNYQAKPDKASEVNPLIIDIEDSFPWEKVIKTKKRYVVNDLSSDNNQISGVEFGSEPLVRYAVIPVIRGKKVVAIAGIANKKEPYSLHDISNLETFTDNAQLLTERYELNEKQKLEHFFLKMAPAIASLGTWQIDLQKKELIYNNETSDIFGLSSEKDTKIDLDYFLNNIVHPDDRELLRKTWSHALETGHYEIEHRVIVKEEVKWVKEQYEIEKNSSGEFVRVFGISQDITREKEKNIKIKEQQILFETIFNAIHDGLLITDTERKIILANDGIKTTFGYTPEEIINKSAIILYADKERFEQSGLKIFSEKAKSEKCEYVSLYKKKDNKLFPGQTFGARLYDGSGKWIGNLAVIKDISEQERFIEYLKAAKETAEQSERLFSTLFSNMEQGFALHKMIYDKNNKPVDYEFILMNKAFERLTGMKAKDFIGCTVKDKLPKTEDTWINNYGEVAGTGSTMHFENYSAELDRYYDVIAYSPQKDYFAVVFTDITSQKKTSQELIAAKEKAEESDRLKTTFLNNMSHEVRTPMNGIIGFSELLKKADDNHEKRRYYSQLIIDSSNQLLKIIDAILEISKLAGQKVNLIEDEFQLNDFLMEVFTLFHKKTIETNVSLYLKKTLPDAESYIITDKSKLYKIITNLIDNALKFTLNGSIEFGYYKKDDATCIYVKDTGIGIDKKNEKFIFERFSQEDKGLTRNFGGLGIGLSIAKENTKILGGNIEVESEKDQGSIFTITLPKSLFSKDNVSSGDNDNIFQILIAEDEIVNYLYLETVISETFVNVIEMQHAKNGKEAVALCERFNFDLILMDIKMPILDGLTATSMIKQIHPKLPVIAQTAYSSEEDMNEILSSGCDNYISKPIEEEKLIDLIKTYMLQRKS